MSIGFGERGSKSAAKVLIMLCALTVLSGFIIAYGRNAAKEEKPVVSDELAHSVAELSAVRTEKSFKAENKAVLSDTSAYDNHDGQACGVSVGLDENSYSLSQADSISSEQNIGAYVTFGRYPQNSGDVPEPVEWLVLDNDGSTALLISKYGLDCKQFHHEFADISWSDCDLRKWLNNDFLKRAFNNEERARIVENIIYTGDNPEFGTKGCGETRDYVFCLDINEANKFFVSEESRRCRPTSYAESNNAIGADGRCCWFWLRTSGEGFCCAVDINDGGAIDVEGIYVFDDSIAVRPALRIKL